MSVSSYYQKTLVNLDQGDQSLILSENLFSVGICVDFCAHIVHGFLTEQGSRGKYNVIN